MTALTRLFDRCVSSRSFRSLALVTGLAALLFGIGPATAPAVAAPTWKIESVANTAAPQGGQIIYWIGMRNMGPDEVSSSEPSTLKIELPPGLTAVDLSGDIEGSNCSGGVIGEASLICTASLAAGAREGIESVLTAAIAPGASGILTATLEISGGGAGASAVTADPTTIASSPPGYGFDGFDAQALADDGATFTEAAGNPHTLFTYLEINRGTSVRDGSAATPVETLKDAWAELPPGLLGNPTSVTECTVAELSESGSTGVQPEPRCPPGSQVGNAYIPVAFPGAGRILPPNPMFNMVPPIGGVARFGFNAIGVTILLDVRLRTEGGYRVSVGALNAPESLAPSGGYFEFWGAPGDPSHDGLRHCRGKEHPFALNEAGPICESPAVGKPFLRMPTSCNGPMPWSMHSSSWENPGRVLEGGAPDLSDPSWKSTSILTHETPGFPLNPSDPTTPWGEPLGMSGCDSVPVKGSLQAQPTSIDTETSSGLEVKVEVPNLGLQNPKSISSSDLKRVEVALPQGVTINPSQAEGLGVCTPAQYESSRLEFNPDGQRGCPSDSKIGTVQVKTQLLEEAIPGNVYIAKPFENPFNSLLALYIVLEEPQRGILVKLPGEVRTNEQTGRIEAEFKDLPQFPFSSFDFKFREGARAPLVTPPTCGTYETVAEIEGWSAPGKPITSKSSFQITRGIGGGPCPAAGTPGFKPSFSAGSINNSAGDFSPFNMRLTRKDGEQDITRFSAVLPPGVLGKLAGVGKCPGSAVAVAKSKTGLQERANPSCPANSEIGRSLVGAGVGSVLTYVPGKIYLGGPFNGRPLSVIAITPAVAGPFDVGTVAVHEALTLNPKTAEVEVDGSASDPIPHMLKGIPAKLRDLRIYVDRPEFTLNPTSCDESATEAELFGGGGNAFTSTDDVPVFLQDRFQAANCAALGFKPRLGLKLKGGTRRGGFPGLQATYRPRSGNANVEGLVVRLPRSAFLEQGHIRTICTRVQFAADACPKGAQYGYIRALTPLLDEPLQGPVWLRSSNNKLPDLVFDLHGLVDIEVATRIDSIRGGVRATVNQIPDAPLTKVVLRMQGGKKGLIVNSRNLCRGKNRANVESDGHNGKISDFNPVMRPQCGGKKRRGKHSR